ncbi:MAG: glycosyltransferase [Candidatus Diapherotrites archaeon]|nr:glycosyltransferase [Candidatus Diapherotrites archaeon]
MGFCLSTQKLSFIIPTLNERPNIEKLLPDLEAYITINGLNAEIIVVDDSSADGTGAFVDAFSKKALFVRLITRAKSNGIGSALQEGYNAATGDVLISMDADLSLKVNEIDSLLKGLNSGADFVVGSKYLPGSVFERSSFSVAFQSKISRIGNRVIQHLSGIPLTDFTLNFRGMHRRVWKTLRPTNHGNFFLTECIFQAKDHGFVLKEVPVTFLERAHGQSKTRVMRQIPVFLKNTLRYSISRIYKMNK